MNTIQKTLLPSLAAVVLMVSGYMLFLVISADESTTEHHEDDDDTVAAYEIYPGDLAEKLQDGADVILLDVRTPEEHEVIHLENSLLLPVQELSQQSLNEIGLGTNAKDKEIYVYCRSGARSKTAYDLMTSLGYTNVKSVAGGMIHWEEDEYPYTEVGLYTGENVQSATAATTGSPKATVDRTLHDFGVITQYGGVVETTFTISNTGDTTLSLGDITTSCSCTSAEVSSKTVSAGESAALTVYFDPDFHEEPLGVFKRTVFIPTDDPSVPELEVAVLVDIIEGQ